MSDRPTPETDEAAFGTGRVSVDFARRLERERDEVREAIFRKPYVWETRFPAEPTPPASNFRYEAEQEGNTMNKEQRNITMREALLRDIADLKRERDEALEIAAKYEDRYFSTLKERDEALLQLGAIQSAFAEELDLSFTPTMPDEMRQALRSLLACGTALAKAIEEAAK